MCGLFGIYYNAPDAVADTHLLAISAKALKHRGPDGVGLAAYPGLGLAHTRLSLVDPDPRSNQPFRDPDERYALVFNGEVYNFRELRGELEARGIRFRTTSDTEVVFRGLIAMGEAFLPRLKGMFALALYDRETEALLLARDRFGTKPLYLLRECDFIAFSSEIKAFDPWSAPDYDFRSITSYLLGFGGPMRGATMREGVEALAPGHAMYVRRGEPVQSRPFFRLTDFWDAEHARELESLSPKAAVDRLEALMWEAVCSQLFADAPIGTFCSGGVDSSLIIAMAAKQHNSLSLFHADLKGSWSEHGAASALARHLKLDLRVIEVTEQDLLEQMPMVMQHYEQPFTYHPNSAPFMLVSGLARSHGIKGLLSGEGSDELFLGYPWFGRDRIFGRYYALGRALRRAVRSVPSLGPLLWPEQGPGKALVRDLLNRGEVKRERDGILAAVATPGAPGVDEGGMWSMEWMHHHLRTLLHRNDSLGMAESIEARFPFLDNDVVRFGLNLPTKYKLRRSARVFEKAHPFLRDKWVVRKVAERWIPPQLANRIKIGFWTTAFERTRIDPRYFAGSHLRDIFRLSQAQLDAFLPELDQDMSMRFLHLDVWSRVCLAGESAESATGRLRACVHVAAERGTPTVASQPVKAAVARELAPV